MKISIKDMFRKIIILVTVLLLTFSFSTISYATDISLNCGEKINYVPSSIDSVYTPSDWTKELNDSYQLKFYESSVRQVTKGEFLFVQLRTIQNSLKRRNLEPLISGEPEFNFNDKQTLCKSAQEEMKLCKAFGLLKPDQNGNMNLNELIERDQAAEVLACINRVLQIPDVRDSIQFQDIDNNQAAEDINTVYKLGLMNDTDDCIFNPDNTITLEEILPILDNEVGYYGISKVDIAKAMNQTFKVTANIQTDESNIVVNSNDSNKTTDQSIPEISLYPEDVIEYETDPAKMPSNSYDYPYIVKGIDREAYEIPFQTAAKIDFYYTPKAIIESNVRPISTMAQVREYIEGYYGAIFNVDYRTITDESFMQQLKPYSTNALGSHEGNISSYVQYVKDNKIILKGTVKFQEPCLYVAGAFYARTKIEFTIVNSDTQMNILFPDFLLTSHYAYNNTNYKIYADLSLVSALTREIDYTLYVPQSNFYYKILNRDTCGITILKN